MWLAIKLAAGRAKMPLDTLLVDQLGSSEDARRYKRWVRDYPEIERGPDQDISSHYQALKKAFEDENSEVDEDHGVIDAMRGRRPSTVPAEVIPSKHIRSQQEIEAERERERFSVPKGMPQRNPGWFTGDAEDVPPPGYGVPPMSRRDPGATLRAPVSPSGRPQQSHEDWVRWLAGKGIYLGPDGRRMSPEDMVLPRRPLTGPQIWQPFTRPATKPDYAGRHRAAMLAVIARYIEAGKAHDTMDADGWELHGDGGLGSWYHKNIEDKTHVIARDGDGWIHNSGPVDGEPNEYGDPEMTGTPMFFDSLGDAVMHAKRGKVQVGFSTKKSPSTVPDSSYHPERVEDTRAIKPLLPPKPTGKFQTLNSTWSES